MRIAGAMVVGGILSVAVTLLALPAVGAGLVRHTGYVQAVDPASGKLVLAEVGPWSPKDAKAVITTRTIDLTASTVYQVTSRADEAPSGFRGDFVLREIRAQDVAAGDNVTAECERQDGALIARTITVFKLEQ